MKRLTPPTSLSPILLGALLAPIRGLGQIPVARIIAGFSRPVAGEIPLSNDLIVRCLHVLRLSNLPSSLFIGLMAFVFVPRLGASPRMHFAEGRMTPALGRALLFVLVVALSLVSPSIASAAEPQKRVLIISSVDANLPAIAIMNQAIRSTLKTALPARVQIYNEVQDEFQIPNEKYAAEMVSLLRRKYEGERIDVIIALSSPALKFLLKYQGELFSNTPIVFLTEDQAEVASLSLGSNVTGVWGQTDLAPTLDIMLALHPETERVVVVAGSSAYDKFWVTKAQNDFRAYESKVRFTYLTDMTIQKLRQELASQPKKNVVLFMSVMVDSAGNNFSLPEALSFLAPTSSAPLYGVAETELGNGVVGGSVVSYEALGTRAAELALRVLAGEKPQDIPPQTVPSVAMFDWRELQRWGIDESKLPAGSIVRYREPTLWEQYKWRIIGVISLCIVEALLIVGLLINRARRRQAENENERLVWLAEAERRRLDEVVSNVPGIVWETRSEPGTNKRKAIFVSEYVEKMLGYSVDEWMSTPGFALTIIPEEDREQREDEAQALFESGKEGVLQFRWVAKDGRFLWVESQVAPIIDETGKPIGLRGVTMDITDRRLAEESLRESEERLQQAISVARFGVFEHDHLTEILHASPLTREIHAWGKQDTPSLEGLVAQVHPEDREMFIAAVERAHDPGGEGFFAREYRIVVDGGKVRWVSARARTFFEGESGVRRPVRTIGAELDITDRKQAEEALRESEERFRNMADTAPVMIWISGPDKLCTYFNQGWLDYTGRSMDQELGTGWTEGVYRDDYDRCLEIYNSAFDRREPFRMEYQLRRADGQFGWIYDNGTPRFSSDGEFLGYIGSCIDISDRKEAENAVRAAKDELRLVADALPVLISEVDKNGYYLFNNHAYEKWFGQPSDQVTGHHMREVLGEAVWERIRPQVESVLAGREVHYEDFLPYRHGGPRWVSVTGIPTRDAEGQVNGFVSLVADITESRRAAEALRDLTGRLINAQEEERSRVARELHDDLSQRIAVLSIGLEQIGQQIPEGPNNLQARIQDLRTNAQEVSTEIHRLSYQLHPSKLDHLGLVSAVKSFCEELAAHHELSIKFRHEGFPAALSKDITVCVFRIVQESLHNAVKHSGAREAQVVLEKTDQAVRLSVSDTGCGFDTESSKMTGGLGFVSMRERLRLVGGQLSIRSRQSEGTTIEVSVPLIKRAARASVGSSGQTTN